MKKRITALFTLVAIMAAMATIPVSAQMYVNDDFDTPPTSGQLSDIPGWGFYNSHVNDSYKGRVSFANGALKFEAPLSGGERPFWQKTYEVSGTDHVIMLDVMHESASTRVSWQLRVPADTNNRIISDTIRGGTHFAADTWYTVMIVVADNAAKARLYYKEKAATDDKWTLLFDKTNTQNAQGVTTFKLGFDCNPVSDGFWMDNFRVFDGINVISNSFKLDSTEIDAVTNVTVAGTLKTEIYTYSDNVLFDSNGVVQLDKTYKTIMVAFDKDGKMLGCNPVDKPVKGGVTAITTELAIDAADAAAISDNGYIATYIWDGMQPVGELIKLGTAPISSTHFDN